MIDRTVLRSKLFVTNEYGYEHQNPNAILSPEEAAYAKKEWNINLDLHRTCINCQVRQMLKYENTVDSQTGERLKTFIVPCKGIPKHMPPGSGEILNRMVNEEGIERKRATLLLQSSQDPVAWAELMFGLDDEDSSWYLRSYQKEQLRCTSQRIVIREGRRTGKTFVVAIKLLHFIFNKMVEQGRDSEGNKIVGGPTIMIVTPFQSQLTGVFDQMEALLQRNKDLAGEVLSSSATGLYVKTPFFHMEFKNGGKINGFISGVGTKTDGSGGGTMRGQSAHIIYLDEMDMIPDETIDKAIMPILLSDLKGEICFIVTSTPIGKRGRFYKFCLEDPSFKEDYLPASVLPQWKFTGHLVTKDASPEAIKTEYMAAFVDGLHGVFKPSYIYRARRDYTYEDASNPNWWKKTFGVTDTKQLIRCIGIDWNKNAGTEFVVITYIPQVHLYVITEAINIPAGEYSALRWREELIRLNYKWKPDYIYADEGYGHTIIEDLKLIAFNLTSKPNKNLQDIETMKLTERLHAFNFSAKISLRNPVDNTVFEKMGKAFLVENAQRIFEDDGKNGAGIVWLPENDNQLKDELMHYVVLKRSATTGKAVYGTESDKIGDHRLDATMLAFAGIQIEAGIYSDQNTPSSVPTFLSKELLEKRETLDRVDGNFIRRTDKPESKSGLNAFDVLKITREGETPEQAASRAHRGVRIERRSRAEPEENPLVAFFKKTPNHSQFERDAPLSEPQVIGRKHGNTRTIRPRGKR